MPLSTAMSSATSNSTGELLPYSLLVSFSNRLLSSPVFMPIASESERTVIGGEISTGPSFFSA